MDETPFTDVDRTLLKRCLAREPGSWNDFVDRFLSLIYHTTRYTAHLRSVLSTILELDSAELLAKDSAWTPGVVDESADLTQYLPGQRTTVEYPGFSTGDAAPSLLPVVVRVEWDAGRGETMSLELRAVVKR